MRPREFGVLSRAGSTPQGAINCEARDCVSSRLTPCMNMDQWRRTDWSLTPCRIQGCDRSLEVRGSLSAPRIVFQTLSHCLPLTSCLCPDASLGEGDGAHHPFGE